MSRFPLFDRSRLRLLPLCERSHDLDFRTPPSLTRPGVLAPTFVAVGKALAEAKRRGAARVLMMGAHVLRCGVQPLIIKLMQEGLIDCLAGNGACAIHDFELAAIGQTTESVARYIRCGQFGLWRETGRLNDIVAEGHAQGLGLGEAVGRAITESGAPYADFSVFAAAYRLGIPFTVHVGIGYDIVCEHPNFDGAAFGETSYRDFLIYAQVLTRLEGGVVMNFGSAVMAPEVYLKALAMVRNVSDGPQGAPKQFTTLVCDLKPLPPEVCQEAPRGHPDYYFRPWKTMLVRTVADGGSSYYVQGSHKDTFPQLHAAALEADRMTP
ncbi:hypothetical protein DSECCO2_647160 [anaerobic digester metagenome]